MTCRPKNHRPGSSLVEVLVGFGILGIAATSVIALFPFSALTIGQALQDDRTTTCAVMADGQMRDVHARFVVEPSQNTNLGVLVEQYFTTMDNGVADKNFGNPNTNSSNKNTPVSTTSTAPSFPVFVDPMGVAAGGSDVGDDGSTFLPRVTLDMLSSNPSSDPTKFVLPTSTVAQRYCSLLDSLSFDDSGQVINDPLTMRELRYTYAWMLQRPVNSDRFTVRMQVVVYNKRTNLYRPPGLEAVLPAGSGSTAITLTPGQTSITNVPATADIRKGTWILDAGQQTAGLRYAEFYRVLSVTDNGGGTVSLEVHKPVTCPDGRTSSYSANLVVMTGVADVFERPLLTAGFGQ